MHFPFDIVAVVVVVLPNPSRYNLWVHGKTPLGTEVVHCRRLLVYITAVYYNVKI